MVEILDNTENDWCIGVEYFDLIYFVECYQVDYASERYKAKELFNKGRRR